MNGAPEAVVIVSRSGTLGSWEGTPRGGARWRCGYYAFDYGSGDFGLGLAKVHYDDGPVDPEPGQPYVLACFDPSDRMVSSILRIYDPADPFGGRGRHRAGPRRGPAPARPPAAAAGAQPADRPARRRADLAVGRRAVGAGLGHRRPSGAVAATVTATPVEVVWDTGDGTTTTCDAGTPYDPTRPPADQRSGCTHVFTRTSAGRPGGTYAVTATVTYEVTWSASTGGAGTLGTLTRSTTIPVRVVEAQALIR